MFKNMTVMKAWIASDDMTRHGMVMVIFGVLSGVISYFFQLTMGIMLTPAQYGTLYSLLASMEILTIFSTAIHTSVTKFASKSRAQGSLSAVNSFWRFSLQRAIVVGSAVFLVLCLLTPLIAGFLNIDNYWYLILLFFSFFIIIVLPVNYGILRGLQRFIQLGSSNTLLAVLKLAIGALLVSLGLGVYGGLLTLIIGSICVFLLTLYFLRDVAGAGRAKFETDGIQSYVWLALLASAAFTLLTNMDVILVKHYLSPEAAGDYSVLAVLARVCFVLPGGVVVAMFPKTSELFETNTSHRSVLIRASLLTIVLAGGISAIYWLFSGFIINLLYGGRYGEVAPYLFKYSVAMLLYALSFLLMNYFMSVNRMKVAFALVVAVLLQVALIIKFHSSVGQIVNIMLVSGALSLGLQLPFYRKKRKT